MQDSTLRLYHDLAWLWPLWGDPAEYGPWCEHVTALIREHSLVPAQSLLNLGCGGGKNAFNLKRHFRVTGLDLSAPMLDNARRLNPDCTFVQGDMRDCDLGRDFDCVVVDDAVAHMLTLDDLAALFRTAFRHVRPGGVMVVAPEYTKESFRQNTTRVSTLAPHLKPDNVDVTFIENEYDPDPTDNTYEFTLVYLIREEGKLRVETDHDLAGLFALEQWRTTLRRAGFEIYEHQYSGPDAREDSPTFACLKPRQAGQ